MQPYSRPTDRTYYHGISTNLKKFMSIIDNGGIMSQNYLQSHNISGLTSHKHTTGGTDLISLAVKPSNSYDTYIKPGIAFIINDIPVIESRRGALSGEVYAKDFIPLSAVKGIYINPEIANMKMKDIDLCAISYGSAQLEDKLKYILKDIAPDISTVLINEYEDYQSQIQHQMNDLMVQQARAPRSQKRQFKNEIELKNQELIQLENSIGKFCTQLFLDVLSDKFMDSGFDISEMTLSQFIDFYIKYDAHLRSQ